MFGKRQFDLLGLLAGASIHWYGKKGVSKNRKLGHVTIVGESADDTSAKLAQIDPEAADALARSDCNLFQSILMSSRR